MLSEELSEMDRITQLQDALEQLFLRMAAVLTYLTSKSSLAQISPQIPLWKSRDKADPPEVFQESQQELLADLISKAKEIEELIDSLPAAESSEQQLERFSYLEAEMKIANDEYTAALARAKTLHEALSKILKFMVEPQQSATLTIKEP